MTLLMLLLAYAGMTALCFAMKRHYQQVCTRPPPLYISRLLCLLGVILLGITLGIAIAGWGSGIGPVIWLGVLSVSGLLLIFILPYHPLWAMTSGLLAIPIAAIIAALHLSWLIR